MENHHFWSGRCAKRWRTSTQLRGLRRLGPRVRMNLLYYCLVVKIGERVDRYRIVVKGSVGVVNNL